MRLLVIGTVLFLSAACVTAGGGGSPFDGADDPSANRITLEVRSLNFNDATIYVFRNTRRSRLGTITGEATEVFQVDWTAGFALRVEIDVVAGGRCVTRSIVPELGDVIVVQIPSTVRQGSC